MHAQGDNSTLTGLFEIKYVHISAPQTSSDQKKN